MHSISWGKCVLMNSMTALLLFRAVFHHCCHISLTPHFLHHLLHLGHHGLHLLGVIHHLLHHFRMHSYHMSTILVCFMVSVVSHCKRRKND
ncbi:hypothetical protein PBPRA2179 [Photobacterium profundum SS9]|uniref:Uncharacterized protein n=1 Tax=Photobacterium profundum (strain SS9) TaxID=298386 RepID=Q6LQ50_PHOPR|nr:hypothetical protein PBPRA2179 [Photobacterium profundum SS9]